jgi:hypothetical protein
MLSVNDVVFDKSIPDHVKQSYLELFQRAERAEKEKEKERAETEKQRAEKAVVQRDLDQALSTIEKVNRDNSLMAPRAIIEYVEIFIFSKYASFPKTKDRVQKWEHFFKNIDVGQKILDCLSEKNVLWGKNATSIAQRVDAMFQSSSDYHHKTSLEINEENSVSISRKAVVMQTFNFVVCVAENLQLQLQLQLQNIDP